MRPRLSRGPVCIFPIKNSIDTRNDDDGHSMEHLFLINDEMHF